MSSELPLEGNGKEKHSGTHEHNLHRNTVMQKSLLFPEKFTIEFKTYWNMHMQKSHKFVLNY